MKASEFRLGNLAYGTDGTVQEITLEAFQYLLKYGESNLCQAKPIPLTEEWLIRLGYQYLNGRTDGDLTMDAGKFEIDYVGGKIQMKSRYQEAQYYVVQEHIKYVHQIQNLHFALTGEELTIKNHNDTQNEPESKG